MRVFELAKQLGVPSKDLMKDLKGLGVSVSTHMAVLEDDTVAKILAKSSAKAKKQPEATPVKGAKAGKAKADPLRGLFAATADGKPAIVEYEPDSDLRDAEQVPLLEDGGIEAFIRREVLPYTPDAWIKEEATKIGYEVSFTRHFYKPQPLRTLDAISADILAIEKEAEGLLDGLLTGGAR